MCKLEFKLYSQSQVTLVRYHFITINVVETGLGLETGVKTTLCWFRSLHVHTVVSVLDCGGQTLTETCLFWFLFNLDPYLPDWSQCVRVFMNKTKCLLLPYHKLSI